MKRLLLTLTLLAVPAVAADWDGQHGNLNVFTCQVMPGFLPMFMPSSQPWVDIFIGTDDPTVTGFTVEIEYGEGGYKSVTIPAAHVGDSAAATFNGVLVTEITAVRVTDSNGVVTEVW